MTPSTDQDAPIPTDRSPSDAGSRLAAAGSIVAAIGSSACCWLPLTALAFGASAAGASLFFERWRPHFALLAGLSLGLGFARAYARSGACGGAGRCDARAHRRTRLTRAALWTSAAAVVAFVSFPQYVGRVYALLDLSPPTPVTGAGVSTDPDARSAVTLVYRVEGMSCEGCAAGLERALRAAPGVTDADVDYATRTATLRATGDAAEPAAKQAADRLGFTLAPAPTWPTPNMKKGSL